MDGEIKTRPAGLGDAERIRSLIHLLKDELVPRSMGNVVENIDRFLVAELGGELVGCSAYQIWPEIGDPLKATVEIQSVAVRAPFRRQGVGRLLVQAVIDRVRAFSPAEVMVLTLTPAFFATLGFHEIPKTHIMHKLYSGCSNCTKHANPFTCPEKAMVLEMRG
ncbi:MAG: GNAT family N-acetyltransferase [Kiritimatiellia bacterium]